MDVFHHVFQPGFKHSKARFLLLGLRQPYESSDDLFAIDQSAEASGVMVVLDEINSRWGRGVLRTASVRSKPDQPIARLLIDQNRLKFNSDLLVRFIY